mmetsp:Transcript_23697/g.61548  ORF Transcript_23697/g.61548 Transcript_23697/m.61548 type:complete len:332 (+) Transcript_23697:422-1417(+)
MDDLCLQEAVRPRAGGERRAGVHLDQPRLEVAVDNDVKAVEFEAVPVVDHHVLARLEGADDDVVDVGQQAAADRGAVRARDVRLQVLQRPLVAVLVVVGLAVLLDCHVGEVHVHVVDLLHLVGVLLVAEPREAERRQVHLQGPVGADDGVQAQVELLAADEEGVVDVARHDVVLRGLPVGRHLARSPFLHLAELVEQEDALPLRARRGLHDPRGVGLLAELLHKEAVVLRQHVRHGHKVQQRGVHPLLLHGLLVPLHILHHQVLARELIMIWEVVDQLPGLQTYPILRQEDLLGRVHVGPVEVPVLAAVVWAPLVPAAPVAVGADDKLVKV